VAALYTHLGRDLREGTNTVPDFAYAHTRHQLMDAIAHASRQKAAKNLV
jgi:hypothetical protein